MADLPTPATAKRPATDLGTPELPPAKQQRRTNGRVAVSVGGQLFETTASTLSNGGTGYFAALFGATGAALQADDEVFVDRSGALFVHVLHWMRTRCLPAALRTPDTRTLLLLADVAAEAEYFGLSDLQAACAECEQEIRRELRPSTPPVPPTARSFSLKVIGAALAEPNEAGSHWWGDNDEMPQPSLGEVVYIHSAVLGGVFAQLRRLNDEDPPTEPNGFATSSCYLHSGRHTFNGNFQLEYQSTDEDRGDEIYLLANRGLDDGACENPIHDINFREVIDMVVDGPIHFRSVGLGEWNVHGWVGPLAAIPRAGGAITRSAGSAAVHTVE